jgi:hypothetical protein
MTISDTQYTAWLRSPLAVRCILVEVDIGLAAGGTTTRYLSNKGYNTFPTDTPANVYYLPRINDGIKFTRSFSLDGGDVSLSFGDIELANNDGALDSWVYDYWANRTFRVYLGDVTWARSDFRSVFSGTTLGIDAKSRTVLNIHISDKLQRLNTTLTETKLGGTTQLYDSLLPLCFGECHNVSPLLTNPSLLEYQVHQGPIESIIEVRDNGVPVSFSSTPATGKFTLNQAPIGQITCSVQGAVIPTNILWTDDVLTSGSWTRLNINSLSTNPVTGPYGAVGGCSSYGMVPTVTNSAHQLYRITSSGITANTTTCFSVFVKLAVGTQVDLIMYDGGGADYITSNVNTTTGVVTVANNAGTGFSIDGYGAVALANGWWRVWLAGKPNSSTTGRSCRIRLRDASNSFTFAGDGSTTYAYVGGAQLEYTTYPSSFWNGAVVSAGAVFRNSPCEIIKYITKVWSSVAANLFTDADYNSLAWIKSEATFRQPVGIFLKDRANMIDVCNQLAASVGARLVIDGTGLVQVVQFADQTAGTGTQITTTDILEHTLEIASLPPVSAGISLGYCKNWTVQSDLAAGLDTSSAALFQEEWLTSTQTDSAAAANYNLYQTPVMTETLLQTASDAATEAVRRLNMFNHQRMVLKYTGFYHLINETLGGAQTLTHPRFGLVSGKTGQITSISVDLLNPHVDFEVLI